MGTMCCVRREGSNAGCMDPVDYDKFYFCICLYLILSSYLIICPD